MILPHTAEVVIIGGGVMGCSIAYHLAARGCRDVMLVEKQEFLAAGATGRCSGGVRHQFSHPTNVQLSIASIRSIERFAEEIGAVIDFHQDGYIFLLSNQTDRATFEKNAAMQKSLGVSVDFLSPAEIRKLVPNLFLEDIVTATFCARDGIADPNGITLGYANAARRLGVQIFTEVEVTGFTMSRSAGVQRASCQPAKAAAGVKAAPAQLSPLQFPEMQITINKVRTTAGEISAKTVVNAAGPFARRIGEFAGVDIPVLPYRRHVFTTHPLAGIPQVWTMVIDFSSSFYFHREGDGLLFGMSDPKEPSSWRESVDWDFLDRVIEVGVKRYPLLENAGIRHAWTGLYEVTPDANPVLGPASDVSNLILANGFSGHGFMHGPALGKAIAEIILDGKASTVDVSEFSLDRFRGKNLAPERNVI